MAKLQKALPDLKIDRGNDNTAEKRMHKHFAIPQDKPLEEQEVKAAILKHLPPGSTPDQVYSYLKKCGVGKDAFSSVHPLDTEGQIMCGIGYDPEEWLHRAFVILDHLQNG